MRLVETPMNTHALYLKMRDMLKQAGVENAGPDADALLRHATGRGRFAAEAIDEKLHAKAISLARRRAKREPLQYILGRWPFMDLELEVGPGVLVPRQETEEVCLYALRCMEGVRAPRVLDLCTGTGALALGFQRHRPDAWVTAVEYEPGAYAWLLKNIRRFAGEWPRVPRPVKADALAFYHTLEPEGLDLVMSNPPYVAEAEYCGLAPELFYEPKTALVPAGDGLLFYRSFAAHYLGVLRPGGCMVLEIGAGQGNAVSALLFAGGFAEVAVLQDMAGMDRIVWGHRPAGG
jgi:release factor glutamine methyltransferase